MKGLPMIVAAALLVFTGCGIPANLALTGVRDVDFTPHGMKGFTFRAMPTVKNPGTFLELKDVSGVLRYKKKPLVTFEVDGLALEPASESEVSLVLKGRLGSGYSLLSAYSMLRSPDYKDYRVDLKYRIARKRGAKGREVRLKKLSVKSLMKKYGR